MKRVSVYLLRDNLSTYLNEVANTGETIIVEKYRKPIVEINPPKNKAAKNDFKRFFGFLKRKGDKETGIEYENRIRRNPQELEHVKKLRRGLA